jgi:formate/nitrite transporter FocA (FNT family)
MAAKRDEPGKGLAAQDEREEAEMAREHSSPRAIIIHEIIREDGEQELTRTVSALMLSGLAAGMSMGFSFLTQALLTASLTQASVAGDWSVLTDFGYSIGFVFVVLGRQQLFTESTLTAVLPLFTNRDLKTLYLTGRLWLIVLSVNLVGTWLFAAMLTVGPIFPADVTLALHGVAAKVLHQPFWITFLRAVLAGWLIALMVWILPSTRSARLLTIILITYVVALGGFVHVVATSSEVAYAVLTGMTSLGSYFYAFFFPTVLGNIVGGVTLVSLLNHGSIEPEIEGKNKNAKKR